MVLLFTGVLLHLHTQTPSPAAATYGSNRTTVDISSVQHLQFRTQRISVHAFDHPFRRASSRSGRWQAIDVLITLPLKGSFQFADRVLHHPLPVLANSLPWLYSDPSKISLPVIFSGGTTSSLLDLIFGHLLRRDHSTATSSSSLTFSANFSYHRSILFILPPEEAMPRHPTRRPHFLKPQPFAFSSFARSVARVASTCKLKRQMHNSKFCRKGPSESAGFTNCTLKEKIEQSESSDEEEQTDHRCMMELREFLLKVCHEKDVIDDLKLLLGEQARNVGLLVSQRVVNLPHQLLPPLYDALFDEVSWATEDEPTEDFRDSFRFKFYLLISKIYKHKNDDKQKGSSNSYNDEAIIYIKAEDEIFHKLSSWSFSFPLSTQQLATGELRNYRQTGLVMALEADKVSTFRQELQSLINGS
ncbi:hypothetical protein HHK36_024511 [Tetracentron sinense]|uniref:Uncharacterized protein n=1 Tax=Tetracentron sinense TaxID=13715 RepID=A0A834YQT3_TETSI|nr:hypothetical protein HHK36_024511 [Tetracentron sinense]